MPDGIRIIDLPNLGAVTDTASFVIDHAGTGRTLATAIRTYIMATMPIIPAVLYGADPTGVADSTVAIRNALAATTGGQVELGPGNFKVSGMLTLIDGASLRGVAGHTTITTAAASFVLFKLAGSNITVENLIIQNAAKTGGADFQLDCTAGDRIQHNIRDVHSWGGFGFWSDTGIGTNAYYQTYLSRCIAQQLRGIGFSFTRAVAYLYLEACATEYLFSPGTVDYASYAFSGAALAGRGAVGGVFLRACSATGTSGTGSNTSQAGFFFDNFSEIWLDACLADNCDGPAYEFGTCNHIHMVNSEASLCNNHGMVLTDSGYGEFSNVRIYGRNAQVSPTASAHGISLPSGNAKLQFTGCHIFNCTGDGINIPVQSASINITGGQIHDCTGHGIATTGASAILASGLTLAGNTAGNYDMAGGLHYLQATQINNGTVVNVGPGPVSG